MPSNSTSVRPLIDVDPRRLAKPRRLRNRGLSRLVDRLQVGSLTLVFPDGGHYQVVGREDGPNALLQVTRPRLLRRLLTGGAMGLAESYIDGDWNSPDLVALLELAARNRQALAGRVQGLAPLRLWHRARHVFRANTRAGSRRNISVHYDLGNDFYGAWLDETMSYSAALFTDPGFRLADAQRGKYRRLAEALDLRPGMRVLEIGCGWGGFAEIAAAEYGCKVVGLTLSREQARFAEARMAEAGLADRVEIRVQDYRDVDGVYDRIASIEMFEAVGEAYWPVYFEVLRDRLKPGGLAALQVITIAEERFTAYRRGADFIQRYVFPGGMLPSPGALIGGAQAAGLRLRDDFRFGPDYGRTLAEWARRFEAAWPVLRHQGFDERFKRLWEYYLAYCEAGFRVGSIDVGHYVLQRPVGR